MPFLYREKPFSQKGNTYCLNHSIFKLSELSIVEAFMHPTVSVSESQLFYKPPPFELQPCNAVIPVKAKLVKLVFQAQKHDFDHFDLDHFGTKKVQNLTFRTNFQVRCKSDISPT